jgi:monofunctional glycosyltransferase
MLSGMINTDSQIQNISINGNGLLFYTPMINKQPLKIVLLVLNILWKTVKAIVLTYAVLFSVAGTIALIVAYNYVTTPIKEVKWLKKHNPVETAYMISYRKELRDSSFNDTLSHIFVPFDSISPHLKSAVLAAEDDGFYTHPGFDIEAILAAYEYNKVKGKVKRGASTITQQLAKNLFLDDSRNFERKFRELAYTVLMEKYLGKERILELYLNYAQWGKNTFGCQAASKQFYKKPAIALNRMESARLAAVLAMPTRVSPNNSHSTFITRRIAVIANNLYLHHAIDDSGFFNLTGFFPANDSSDTDSISDDSSSVK